MECDEETRITEITLQADGRIYVFGLSREVLAILSELCPAGHPLLELATEQAACDESQS